MFTYFLGKPPCHIGPKYYMLQDIIFYCFYLLHASVSVLHHLRSSLHKLFFFCFGSKQFLLCSSKREDIGQTASQSNWATSSKTGPFIYNPYSIYTLLRVLYNSHISLWLYDFLIHQFPSLRKFNKQFPSLAFRNKLRAYLVRFIRKRWSWKDWMGYGGEWKATLQRRIRLGIGLVEAPLTRDILCQIMMLMVIIGFLTILVAEQKASRG